jgi:hypothetical protein
LSGIDLFSEEVKSEDTPQIPPNHEMWALDTILPNLTNLSLQHSTSTAATHSFDAEDILRLPRGLKTLRVKFDRVLDKVEGIRNLPRSLEVLVCRGVKASNWTPEHSKSLPPGLIELELSEDPPFQTFESIALLPRTLTRIHPIPVMYERDLNSIATNPDQLTRDEAVELYYKSLPPNLTRFRLPATPLNPLNTIGKMPSHVTELDLSADRTSWLDGKDLTLIPSHISSLTLYRLTWPTVEPHFWPRDLTKLEIKEYRERDLPDWSKMPRSLQTLKWHATPRSQAAHGPLHKVCNLPPSLKEIYMWMWGNIDAECFEMPKTLTRLSIFLIRLPRPVSALLPATLIHARLSTDSDWSDDEIAALPRSLRYLRLSRPIAATANAFLRLPPSLTYLAMSFNIKPLIDEVHAAGLPRTILELELSQAHWWTSESAILALPPLLTSLDSSFPLRYIALVPKSLQRLCFRSDSGAEPLTEEIIKIIPPTLRYLQVAECSAPETSVDLVPPSCEISLSKKKGPFWRHYQAEIQRRAIESMGSRPDPRTFRKVNNLD